MSNMQQRILSEIYRNFGICNFCYTTWSNIMEGDNIKNENKLRSYNNEENSSVV